jgi:hypothetical protein
MMFLKGPLGAFGFLQEKASFVDPKAAIEKPAKTTSSNLAYFFKFVLLVLRLPARFCFTIRWGVLNNLSAFATA